MIKSLRWEKNCIWKRMIMSKSHEVNWVSLIKICWEFWEDLYSVSFYLSVSLCSHNSEIVIPQSWPLKIQQLRLSPHILCLHKLKGRPYVLRKSYCILILMTSQCNLQHTTKYTVSSIQSKLTVYRIQHGCISYTKTLFKGHLCLSLLYSLSKPVLKAVLLLEFCKP